jgi:hypothetical protein
MLSMATAHIFIKNSICRIINSSSTASRIFTDKKWPQSRMFCSKNNLNLKSCFVRKITWIWNHVLFEKWLEFEILLCSKSDLNLKIFANRQIKLMMAIFSIPTHISKGWVFAKPFLYLHTKANADKGCQIFLCATYQNGEKYTTWPQNVPNGNYNSPKGLKVYQNGHKICPYFPFQGPPKLTQIGTLVRKNFKHLAILTPTASQAF